jgi:HK97 family phage prohead protease
MKTTFELTKFLKSLPNEEWANAIAELTKDAPEPVVKRGAAKVELKFDEPLSSTGLITTPMIDRDQEIVVPTGMNTDSYKENPVLLYGHRWGEPPIGSQKDLEVSTKGIQATQTYASTPFATDIATLVREGHLKTFSIGFVPLERYSKGQEGFADAMEAFVAEYADIVPNAEKAKILTTKSVLLENSVVNIPANPGAQVMSVSKALGLTEETIKDLGIEIEELEEIAKQPDIRPLIKVIKKPEVVDTAAIVREQLRILKGGI